MASLQKIVKVTQAQYKILASGGAVGDYEGLNPNYLYLVQDDGIESLVTRVTYSQLKNLRDTKQLIPGMKYQITNYKTTTKAYNTSTAGHDFDIVVEALTEDTLSEDAKAVWRKNDTYFMRQYLNKASWATPLPELNDLKDKFTYFIQEGNDPREQYDADTVFTEMTTVENRDGIEVPAIFQPAPDGDEYWDCYYVYDGTYQIIKGKNELVSALYYSYFQDDDLQNYGQNEGYKDGDLFTHLESEIRNKPISAQWKEDSDPIGDRVQYIVFEEDGEVSYQTDDVQDVDTNWQYRIHSEIRETLTVIHPRWGIEVPAFYGNKNPYWLREDEDYDDPNNETVDYEHIFVYDGQTTIDGEVYDRWIKVQWNPDPNELYASDILFDFYCLTANYVDAELENINIPILYKTDNIDTYGLYGRDPDYADTFKFWDNIEINGVEYSRWIKYSKNSGLPKEDGPAAERGAWAFVLTQKIVDDNNEFTITQDQLNAAVGSAVSVYDKWIEYYPHWTSNTQWQTGNIHLSEHLIDADIKNVPLAQLDAWELKYCIDNDLNRFSWADTVKGKGVVYYLKDEFNNEAPYDFKNILLTEDEYGFTKKFTFNYYNEDTDVNIDASLTSGRHCYNNIIKSCYTRNDDGNPVQDLNYNIFTDIYDCYDNYLDEGCKYNIFDGNNIYRIRFATNNSYNYIEQSCNDLTFGNSCTWNNISWGSHDLTFGNSCANNQVGRQSFSINLKQNCYENTIGRNSYQIDLGLNCHNNTLGVGCYNIKFESNNASNNVGQSCYNLQFNAVASSNVLAHDCSGNLFGIAANQNQLGQFSADNMFQNGACENKLGEYNTSIIFGINADKNVIGTNAGQINYVKNIIFENGCNNIKLTQTGDSGAANASNQLQNIRICSGIINKTIQVKRNLSYDTTVRAANAKEIILD